MNTEAIFPFQFSTRLHLSELTGLRAANLSQLLECIKNVPPSSIYYHTHRFLQQFNLISPQPPNDFAYWVSGIGEEELAEQLAAIDTMRYSKIHELQSVIAQTIEDYLKNDEFAKLRFARKNEEFHFIKSVSFVIRTNFIAHNLEEFCAILKKITIDSIYFHMFEARLRLGRASNDFSAWIDSSVGDKALADVIAGLDPYTRSLENLRMKIIDLIEKRLSQRRQ